MKDGAHTHGPQGGGPVLVIIIAAVLIGSGAASAIATAVATIAITLAVVTGVGVAGVVGLLVYRARSERPGRPFSAPVVSRIGPAARPQLEETYKPATTEFRNGITELRAIEPPQLHLHFHGLSPAEVAETIRQAIPGTAGDAGTDDERR